ncbi:MAG: cob(I)yrinic acid a,c-diamide adenosyltransferase [Chloroflexi bacterium]|nr:cob(I)yrinic acid a,c-diamide adenosyltransferase [Chloroflexota bacterium]MCL5105253.1 cob(I)yrinic acid a,c-diamide adenosyltransferase [Armatimonadota bacterium]
MPNSGRILIFTGDGKGKTTAALGMALRASGHGLRVKIIQFVKADSSVGEIAAVESLPGVEIVQTGRGFLPADTSPAIEAHREAANEGLRMAGEALRSGDYDLVVLDEICFAVARKLLDENEVIEVVKRADPNTTVVMTGRGAADALVDIADTVTEMRVIKHAMSESRPAQRGVEY